ncbi:hypothetical protein [Novosphingobium sp.]|uniref:hypothetical protein n=1 Tax=Novosphingobium sp. TaxID=1874826 RepID=UPI003BA971DA
MSAPRPTVDEVIGTLQHSCDPTLLAEGIDDIAVLRRFEDEFFDQGLSVLPLGGRAPVLEIFDRRHELPDTVVVLFLVDQDLWVYTGVPETYSHCRLLFTDGYSIENDLYRDGNLERLLTAGERRKFRSNLEQFLEWYASNLTRKLDGEEVALSVHPRAILPDNATDEADKLYPPNVNAYEQNFSLISGNYTRLLRGKSLMALLVMQLSAPNRVPKHSVRSLMEHGAVAGGVWMNRIREWLASHL